MGKGHLWYHIAKVATDIQDLPGFFPFSRTVVPPCLGPLVPWFRTHPIVIFPIRYSTHIWIWDHANHRQIHMYHKHSSICSCTMFNKPVEMSTQCTGQLFMLNRKYLDSNKSGVGWEIPFNSQICIYWNLDIRKKIFLWKTMDKRIVLKFLSSIHPSFQGWPCSTDQAHALWIFLALHELVLRRIWQGIPWDNHRKKYGEPRVYPGNDLLKASFKLHVPNFPLPNLARNSKSQLQIREGISNWFLFRKQPIVQYTYLQFTNKINVGTTTKVVYVCLCMYLVSLTELNCDITGKARQ